MTKDGGLMFNHKRTQIAREDVSRPLKSLVSNDEFMTDMRNAKVVLHFGEGKAYQDTDFLFELTPVVIPYDPYSRDRYKRDYTIVSDFTYDVGVSVYVFNVLPPIDRDHALKTLLGCVGKAYICVRTDSVSGRAFADGVITSADTFQKSYDEDSVAQDFPGSRIIKTGSGFIWFVMDGEA